MMFCLLELVWSTKAVDVAQTPMTKLKRVSVRGIITKKKRKKDIKGEQNEQSDNRTGKRNDRRRILL